MLYFYKTNVKVTGKNKRHVSNGTFLFMALSLDFKIIFALCRTKRLAKWHKKYVNVGDKKKDRAANGNMVTSCEVSGEVRNFPCERFWVEFDRVSKYQAQLQ